MSAVIATFRDIPSGVRAVRDLLSGGIEADDISFVARTGNVNGHIGKLEDASYMIGRSDDPIDNPAAGMREGGPQRTRYVVESPIGAGIATSSPDDDASTLDEMDDSQSAEDDLFTPAEDRPQSRHEVDDLQLTLETGFPTPMLEPDPVTDAGVTPDHELDESLDVVRVAGFGVVMGGGSFATAALDLIVPGDLARFESFLESEGVPTNAAKQAIGVLEFGGGLLAVAAIPGETDPDAISEIARRCGATDAALYDAPRF